MCDNDIFMMDLTPNEKLTYIYLCRCKNADDEAFPSYADIANKCSFSLRTAKYAISILEEKGLIKVLRRSYYNNNKKVNKPNLYTVCNPYRPINKEEEDPRNKKRVVHLMHYPGAKLTRGVVHQVHHPGAASARVKRLNKKDLNNNTQSVRHIASDQKMIKKEIQPIGNTTDLQIEFLNFKDSIAVAIGVENLKAEQPFDKELINEIFINILDMHQQDCIIVNGDVKYQHLVREALNMLTCWHIKTILDKYKAKTTKITNSKSYIQAMIFNQAFENDLTIRNEVNNDKLNLE